MIAEELPLPLGEQEAKPARKGWLQCLQSLMPPMSLSQSSVQPDKPVARKAGITKNIGWHTFRHSFGTLLKANGEDIKTVQELLRHANSRITLDVYTQAVTSNKRAAQSKVVRMMVPDAGTKKANVGTMDFEKIAVNAR